MIEVPWQEIAPDTLRALVEEYVTRDGTDYGEREVSVARRVEQVMALLRRGELVVVFEPVDESVNIVGRDGLAAVARSGAPEIGEDG